MKYLTNTIITLFVTILILGGTYASANSLEITCSEGQTLERTQLAPTCPHFTQWMKKGDKDGETSTYKQENGQRTTISEVAKLQSWLNTYFNTNIMVDGIFGTQTHQAVKTYQDQPGLRDYIINPWLSIYRNRTTGNFKNTSMYMANYLMGCHDDATFLEDVEQLHDPFEREDTAPLQRLASDTGTYSWQCTGSADVAKSTFPAKQRRSMASMGILATGDISAITSAGNISIDSSGSSVTGTAYEGWYHDTDNDYDPTTGTITWSTEQTGISTLVPYATGSGTIPGMDVEDLQDGETLCHIVSTNIDGTVTADYLDQVCYEAQPVNLFFNNPAAADYTCTAGVGYTYPITLIDGITNVNSYNGAALAFVAHTQTLYPSPYITQAMPSDLCNVMVLFGSGQVTPTDVETVVPAMPIARMMPATFNSGADSDFDIPVQLREDDDLTALVPADTITIDIKHQNGTILETLNGNVGDDISTLTTNHGTPANSVIAFATGAVSDAGTITFDKQSWAIQNSYDYASGVIAGSNWASPAIELDWDIFAVDTTTGVGSTNADNTVNFERVVDIIAPFQTMVDSTVPNVDFVSTVIRNPKYMASVTSNATYNGATLPIVLDSGSGVYGSNSPGDSWIYNLTNVGFTPEVNPSPHEVNISWNNGMDTEARGHRVDTNSRDFSARYVTANGWLGIVSPPYLMDVESLAPTTHTVDWVYIRDSVALAITGSNSTFDGVTVADTLTATTAQIYSTERALSMTVGTRYEFTASATTNDAVFGGGTEEFGFTNDIELNYVF